MQFIEPLFDAGRIGWTMLGLASLLLVVAVLIAARLRWTQSRPITACVILSVFAHILLVCSAHLTRIFDVPVPPGDVAISIQFEDSSPVPSQTQSSFDSDSPIPSQSPLPAEKSPPADAANVVNEPEVAKAPAEIKPESQSYVISPEAHDLPDTVEQPKEPPAMEPNPDPPAPEPESLVDLAQPTVPDETPLKTLTPSPPVATVSPLPSPAPTPSALKRIPETPSVTPTLPNPLRDPPVAQPESAWRTAKRAKQTTAPKVPARYSNRVAENRAAVARHRGGNPNTDAAVRHALRWLAENQREDGRWDAARHGAGQGRLVEGHFRGPAGIKADTGISGLALLAFLGDGHTHKSGRHKKIVAKGLEYLLGEQATDGNLCGPSTNFARMYCHGIASMALNEAYAMTSDQRLLPYVQNAVNYSLSAQSPVTGGWRYHPGDDGDTSQFGWQVMALLAAEQGGIAIPDHSKSGMQRFLRSVSMGGLAGYRAGYSASRPMTAEALACRVFLSEAAHRNVNEQQTREAANYLRDELPGFGQPNYYYWYYATLALAQADSELWPIWNNALQMQLLRTQSATGAKSGSWEPNSVWGGHGGRVYSTALATMCLEVYYRY